MDKKILSINNKLTKIILWIASIEILIGTVIVFATTISRYFLGISWEWAEELLRYVIICAALLYSGPMIFDDTHIVMDFFSSRITNPKMKIYHQLLSASAVAVCSILMMIYGWELTITSEMRSYSLIFPMWLSYSIVPISMFVITAFCFLKIAYLITAKPGLNEGGEATK